jgi:hypothetical protein
LGLRDQRCVERRIASWDTEHQRNSFSRRSSQWLCVVGPIAHKFVHEFVAYWFVTRASVGEEEEESWPQGRLSAGCLSAIVCARARSCTRQLALALRLRRSLSMLARGRHGYKNKILKSQYPSVCTR